MSSSGGWGERHLHPRHGACTQAQRHGRARSPGKNVTHGTGSWARDEHRQVAGPPNMEGREYHPQEGDDCSTAH